MDKCQHNISKNIGCFRVVLTWKVTTSTNLETSWTYAQNILICN